MPFQKTNNDEPSDGDRLFLVELGVAGHPSQIGGMQLNCSVPPNKQALFSASHHAIVVVNQMSEAAEFSIQGQVLTGTGRELIGIANSPPTDIEFLKKVAKQIVGELRGRYSAQIESDLLKVHIATTTSLGGNRVQYDVTFTATDN